MLKYALVGLGGLGKAHLSNLLELEKDRGDIELVALCDIDEKSFTEVKEINLGFTSQSLDIDKYNIYYDIDHMLEKEELDFIVSAVPTYVHAKIAIKALNKGIHVFSEKPMALKIEDAKDMIEAADKNNRFLMIGQCLRYWPEYVKLKALVDTKVFGNVIKGEFSRNSPTPTWSWKNWMMDFEKSGGAALDLHVHDVDIIYHLFGMPKSIFSLASHHVTEFDSIASQYEYDGFYIRSACDWGFSSSYPFSPYFLVRFERATVEMKGEGLLVYEEGKEAYPLKLEAGDAYVLEMMDFIDSIKENRKSLVNDPSSVKEALKIALWEMDSAKMRRKIHIP